MFDAWLRTQLAHQFDVSIDNIERTYRGDRLSEVKIDLPNERILTVKYESDRSVWEVCIYDDEGNLADNRVGDPVDSVEGITDAIAMAAKLLGEADVSV